MVTGNLPSHSPSGDIATTGWKRHSLPSPDMLAALVQRSKTNHGAVVPDRLDAKRLIERAIEIDAEQPGSPLTEGQWDFGLDMLARADVPAEGSGLAVRQERIVVALSQALAELATGEKPLVA